MNELTALQARVLGCLMEKKETTPDQYPLTQNAIRNACNQKTARNPVMDCSEGDVGHTLRELESLGLVRETWGARTPKYEHLAGKAYGLHSKGLAILCVLLLRGPQTPGELKTNTHRLYAFDDLDDIHYVLQRMAEHEPPLVTDLPRQPGQKEVRFAHLLCGEPDVTEIAAGPAVVSSGGLAERVSELEAQVSELSEVVEKLLERLEPEG